VNEVTDQLWVTDIDGVALCDTSRFDRVVSVCQDERAENVGCRYDHHALADDAESERNWGGSATYSAFANAVRTVVDALVASETVLVHCHSGKNRSVAISATALAVADDGSPDTFDDCVWEIKDARPIANPNEHQSRHGRRFVADDSRSASR
jgi:predicted protein tyrosine phosphatase